VILKEIAEEVKKIKAKHGKVPAWYDLVGQNPGIDLLCHQRSKQQSLDLRNPKTPTGDHFEKELLG